MFDSFMSVISFFVLVSCLVCEHHCKTDHLNSSHHKSHSAGGEGLSRGKDGLKGPDFTKCSSEDSLCDTVLQFNSIDSFLLSITRKYPQTAKLKVIGRSYGHRPIYSMEIFHGVDHAETATMVVEFGMHGREWASHASAVFMIRRLLEEGRNFTTSVRWFILPVMNPDGYHHSVTEDNMWKKNRSPHKESRACVGVNVDRNFDIGWELNTENEPCKEDYPGARPFSEFESNALKRFIESLGPFAVDVYVSVHSCGQTILHPYGHTTKELSKWKLGRLRDAGLIMSKAMKKIRNRNYDLEVAYKFGGFRGSAADYMFAHFHIPYVYTLELGDRVHFEEYDFHHCYHPPSVVQMDYLTQECYAGLTALATYIESTQETMKGPQIPRSFNSFPSITCPFVKLIALVTIIL